MIGDFELELLGGATERRFRKRRGPVDDLPWEAMRPAEYDPKWVERARVAWTESAYAEYCTAASFAEIVGALLAARAPIDLVAMVGDFVADEMLHVELNARMAMVLGGGAPFRVDFSAIVPPTKAELASPRARANELVVRTCCVGEALSVPLLVETMEATEHPLTRALFARIAKDEAPHARFGEHHLGWASEEMDDAERARLGEVAREALAAYAPEWSRAPEVESAAARAELHALGWLDAPAWGETARRAARERVIAPLARFGIMVPSTSLCEA